MIKINRALIIYALTVFGVAYYFLRRKRRVTDPIKTKVKVVQEKVETPLPVYEKRKKLVIQPQPVQEKRTIQKPIRPSRGQKMINRGPKITQRRKVKPQNKSIDKQVIQDRKEAQFRQRLMEKPTGDINFVPGLMSKGVTVIANKRGKNMSASDCQQMARENDEAIAWTHRNHRHNVNWRNTCKLYGSMKPWDEKNPNDKIHLTGCANPKELLKLGCKTPEQIRKAEQDKIDRENEIKRRKELEIQRKRREKSLKLAEEKSRKERLARERREAAELKRQQDQEREAKARIFRANQQKERELLTQRIAAMAKSKEEGLEKFHEKETKNFKNKLKQIEKWLKLGGHPRYQKGIELNKYTLSPIEKLASLPKPMKDMLNQLHRVASNLSLNLPDLYVPGWKKKCGKYMAGRTYCTRSDHEKLWEKNKIIGGERYLKDWVPEASKIKGPNGILLYATEPRFVPKMNDDWNKLTKTMEKTNYSGYFGSYKPANNEKIIFKSLRLPDLKSEKVPKSEGFESGINYLKRNRKYVSANGQVYLIIKEVPWNRVPVGKNKIRPTSGLEMQIHKNGKIQKRKIIPYVKSLKESDLAMVGFGLDISKRGFYTHWSTQGKTGEHRSSTTDIMTRKVLQIGLMLNDSGDLYVVSQDGNRSKIDMTAPHIDDWSWRL